MWWQSNTTIKISIHALLAESDFSVAFVFGFGAISIHALLAESDICQERQGVFSEHFYPRSPCGERQPRKTEVPGAIEISIHALLAESDLRVVDGSKSSIISIHALLAESDGNNKYTQEGYQIFLSTLSLRRATTHPIGVLVRVVFLSTLSLRRATV